MSGIAQPDWTGGVEAILFQRCLRCRAVWYFRRDFCPHCGNESPETLRASGRGAVYATTIVHRAPSAALRERAPYQIVLIDAVEGFRLMAHAAPGLRIGDIVQARFIAFGDGIVPYFDLVEQRVGA